MSPDQFKPHPVRPPPRTLNVQKFAESRAPELEALHSIVSSRLNHDFRSQRNKRRRTTGHDDRIAKNRSRKRRKLGKTEEGIVSASEKDGKISRRARRRIELKSNPVSGFCVSGDGTKRLGTHVWHAKRFEMTKRWGFYLPLGLQGRGRGSRSLLKWLKNGTLIHDASYCCAVQLEGPEESIVKIFRMVMVPPPSIFSGEPSKSICRGACYGNAMLHHVGAPHSQFIAPVTFMWRPSPIVRSDTDVENNNIVSGHCTRGKSECSTSCRQLWVWIHAAAFDEGFDVLRYACQELMNENGTSVNCFSLDGKLARLEVMGAKAIQVLQKILHPVAMVSDTSKEKCAVLEDDKICRLGKSFVLENAEHLPAHAIVSLMVQDPRDIPVKAIEGVPETSSNCAGGDILEGDSQPHASMISEALNRNREIISALWSKPEACSIHFSDSEYLWAYDQVNPPIEENLLSMEKHHRRLSFFYLDNTNSGTLTTGLSVGSARSCPILLLKNTNNGRGSCMGWSIILPLSWVKAFWIPLVSYGAQAIGLRERQWVACDAGVPYFPYDFPDCKSYSSFMSTKASASDERAKLRPLALRPLRVPIPSPWDCVNCTVTKEWTSAGDHQTQDVQLQSTEPVCGSSLVNLNVENCDTVSLEEVSFPGFIARTSGVLNAYLNEMHCRHLPLFPDTAMGTKVFSELMDKGRLSWAPKGAIEIPANRKLCFLRVLLHAYKEGVFEEGAVVCSPLLVDLSSWMTRSDEQHGLKIHPLSIKSYFTQGQSGKWELQIPEDPLARQSHRWPLGFVTTGFVQGSTKPMAEAFCEATLLARLRAEQWGEMQEKGKPQVFVLVRNLRSVAYRLALATIVVEQQAEDTEFMLI